MHKVYIGIGTNLGDRLAHIKQSLKLIGMQSKIHQISSVYETPPLGFDAHTNFLNIVIEIETKMNPEQLLSSNQQIEKNLGRIYYNDGKYHSRVIDLDILLFEDMEFKNDFLQIPHPHIQQRNFVLLPLLEIAPEISVPGKANTQFKDFLNETMQIGIEKIENSILTPY
ncbi:MAG: 2-amino-4-hydroxy-6-hydroxymethyldihydropteridine diphosphokinase [Crocinitomicaceae bacterium]